MKYVIILGIIALLMLGYVYQLLFSSPANEIMTEGELSGQIEYLSPGPDASDSKTGRSTLDEIRGWGENLECTISYSPDDTSGEVEGTYFVSLGNIRGDFLTPAPDLEGQVLSSIIIKNSTMYTWSEIEGEFYGMKLDISDTDSSSIETNEPVSLDDNVRYSCKDWENVDQTVFNPPSDILFQDLSDIRQSGMEYGTVYRENESPL